ncbi:MAG: heavy-metal-associated domain-containing protein [Gemmatimonadota bacterium]
MRAVTNALKQSEGVRDAQVDLKAGRAVVEYDEGETDARQLANAVMDEGYSAEELV